MTFSTLDWLVIAGYAVFALGVGIVFARRAGRDVDEFFLSGRTLPWWLAGTSMVATTFASDTPLVITGWVRDAGIWQNWLWWCLAGGGLLTVFLFSRYWRRGEVMTTAELAELRYGGTGAKVLRGFLGTYQALITNTIILCWVILAAAKIMDVLFEVDKVWSVSAACALALTYSSLAGFWGVVTTDLVQFTMAMVGSVVLAVFSWNAIGGIGALEEGIAAGTISAETLSFIPPSGETQRMALPVATGFVGGLMMIFGLVFGIGHTLLGASLAALISFFFAAIGTVLVILALKEIGRDEHVAASAVPASATPDPTDPATPRPPE
ncbi:MAG: hypothetical protein GY711_11695 [bacterium]|nr:hypothetical protein [bacterium]